jgi:hypothetical protein
LTTLTRICEEFIATNSVAATPYADRFVNGKKSLTNLAEEFFCCQIGFSKLRGYFVGQAYASTIQGANNNFVRLIDRAIVYT